MFYNESAKVGFLFGDKVAKVSCRPQCHILVATVTHVDLVILWICWSVSVCVSLFIERRRFSDVNVT